MSGAKTKDLFTSCKEVFNHKLVELQGFEPWSRQGNRRAFYMLSCRWVFERV